MAIRYLYSGQPMNGSEEDDFVIAFKGSTGTDNNTILGNGGDDLVIADSSDTWIPNSSYLNGSIANAFNLETLTSTWTTAENAMFGDSGIPHTTAIVEATIGQSEFFRVAIGAGQQITVDIDFASNTAIGITRDLVVELQDSLGNIIATADDSLVTDGGRGSFPSTPGSASSYDPYLTFTVASAGLYYINVRPFGGGPGSTFTENSTFVMNLSVTGHATAAANPVQGNDIVDGGAGDDALFGGGGGDTINGGVGNDLIDGGSGGDIIHGDDGNDVVYGGDGTEENAHGDGGDDVLYSGGEGHYYGDAGDDVIHAGLTSGVNEVLDGGTGIDTVDTTTWNGAYEINLVTGATNFGESFTNFENVITGNGDDFITGTAGNNRIETRGGVDTVDGGNGNDEIEGGAGNDVLDGGAGSDLADYGDKGQQVSVVLDGANDATVTVGGIAEDTIRNFENVRGGAANDTLTGNGQGNRLYGGIGNDTLRGEGGNDTLDGGLNTDTMTGGAGNDTYVVDSAGDVVIELASGGTDLVQASLSCALGSNLEKLTLTGSANIDGTGNSAGNTITGNAGDNVLNGGGGADTMAGGAGGDTYVVDNAGDVVTELTSKGTDLVKASLSYTLGNFVENLTLTGSSNINGTGNASDNVITGNTGRNVLDGGNGADTLNGAAGADTMAGGTGNDIYVVDNAGDVVTEQANGGTDLVKASLSYTLGSNLEKLILLGSANINGTGNTLDNVLTGNSGKNALSGGSGADTLDGAAGADTMAGGTGNDIYVVDNAGDVVTEAAGSGTDLVNASRSHALGSNVENLTLTGAAAINGTGNGLANVIVGNNAVNHLNGGAGVDVLTGNGGADVMDGGEHGDTYNADSADIIHDSGISGIDRVLSSGSFTLAAGSGIEQLTTKAGVVGGNLTGDEGANIITGNTGTNILSGKAGNDNLSGDAGTDTLIGGIGRDRMTGGADADIFRFAAGDSAATSVAYDTVQDFETGSDKTDLSIFAGSATAAAYAEIAVASNAFATLKSAAEAQMGGGVKAVFVAGSSNGWLFWNTDAIPGTAEEAVTLTGCTSLNDFAVGDLM